MAQAQNRDLGIIKLRGLLLSFFTHSMYSHSRWLRTSVSRIVMIAVGNSLHYIITLERAGPRWAAAKIGNTVIPPIHNSEATHGGELVFTLLTPFLDFFGGAHAAFC